MKEQSSSASKSRPYRRYLEIDFLRGVAILMMILFHFLFDLSLFKIAQVPIFTNPFWLLYREAGVFVFMAVSGFCLVLEHQNQIRWKLFWKRFIKLLLAGALITIATYYYNSSKTIWLGILQFFAFSSLLGLYFLRFEKLNLVLGVLIIALGFIGNINEAPNYIGPAFTWMGFGTMHLSSLEIFPLIPFFGYVLVGIYMGKILIPRKTMDYFLISIPPQNPLTHFIAFFGKHSLLIYLIHQPILLAILYLWKGQIPSHSI